MAVGLRRLHRTEIFDVLTRTNQSIARQGLVTARPAATRPIFLRDSLSCRARGGGCECYAFALGRAETVSRQRRTSVSSSGIASFDTFMKSTATSAVMSAMVKRSPAI